MKEGKGAYERKDIVLDEYDRHLASLIANPETIQRDWAAGIGIFQSCQRVPSNKITESHYLFGKESGCLTMIRYGGYHADTESLTIDIQGDGRIPHDPRHFTADNIAKKGKVLAEWHRRLDRIYQKGLKA